MGWNQQYRGVLRSVDADYRLSRELRCIRAGSVMLRTPLIEFGGSRYRLQRLAQISLLMRPQVSMSVVPDNRGTTFDVLRVVKEHGKPVEPSLIVADEKTTVSISDSHGDKLDELRSDPTRLFVEQHIGTEAVRVADSRTDGPYLHFGGTGHGQQALISIDGSGGVQVTDCSEYGLLIDAAWIPQLAPAAYLSPTLPQA